MRARAHAVWLLLVVGPACAGEVHTPSEGGADGCTLDQASLGVVEEILVGGSNACVRYSSGQVWCWGDNRSGQLANADAWPISRTPVQVQGASCIVELGGTGALTCVRDQATQVWCWGSVLLDAAPASDHVSFPVPGATGVIQTTVWGALRNDRSVLFWSWWHWELQNAWEPLTYAPVGDVAALPRHGDPRCQVTLDRRVRCFGRNVWGEVGDGTTMPRVEPADVVGVEGVVQLATSGGNGAALLSDGSVSAWGQAGTTGVGVDQDASIPASVVTANGEPLSEVISLSIWSTGGCVVRHDQSVWCWGYTGQGDVEWAIPIQGLGPAIDVGMGSGTGCALLQDRSVWCWGDNLFGELGNNSFEDQRFEPAPVALPVE